MSNENGKKLPEHGITPAANILFVQQSVLGPTSHFTVGLRSSDHDAFIPANGCDNHGYMAKLRDRRRR